jgi:hypothetical protein
VYNASGKQRIGRRGAGENPGDDRARRIAVAFLRELNDFLEPGRDRVE